MDNITVTINLPTGEAIVRKVILDDQGMIDYKQGLDKNGNWITVPEAARYPQECMLSIVDQAPARGRDEWASDVVAVVSMEVMDRLHKMEAANEST